ncbi:hypothetical protein EMIHUDRAFT_110258 [Emiliania huxleyi CCMP1516]|uniref:AP2/ERF domain-containing protein n=2 Tax=Emiliania huxleyi TaxID=2903 RepID=A0A0D3KKX6_EMIH1|nr:hypothetical protein EMIHUDRAFT_110258 [Emiliania huxleyi CCMP1516]EOD36411.1 hypothetical protein EMIHUDRAFT_110258 [Emiliania huxleyi CCMP1516]|eukprot:XP_005788840.1 hypothetical protein EMIHUDRAFT_110258 [Emiliania huxleyi CCMP1516]
MSKRQSRRASGRSPELLQPLHPILGSGPAWSPPPAPDTIGTIVSRPMAMPSYEVSQPVAVPFPVLPANAALVGAEAVRAWARGVAHKPGEAQPSPPPSLLLEHRQEEGSERTGGSLVADGDQRLGAQSAGPVRTGACPGGVCGKRRRAGPRKGGGGARQAEEEEEGGEGEEAASEEERLAELNERVRDALRERGLNLQQLACHIGFSSTATLCDKFTLPYLPLGRAAPKTKGEVLHALDRWCRDPSSTIATEAEEDAARACALAAPAPPAPALEAEGCTKKRRGAAPAAEAVAAAEEEEEEGGEVLAAGQAPAAEEPLSDDAGEVPRAVAAEAQAEEEAEAAAEEAQAQAAEAQAAEAQAEAAEAQAQAAEAQAEEEAEAAAEEEEMAEEAATAGPGGVVAEAEGLRLHLCGTGVRHSGTGYKGVTQAAYGRFRAQRYEGKRCIYIGLYGTAVEAAVAFARVVGEAPEREAAAGGGEEREAAPPEERGVAEREAAAGGGEADEALPAAEAAAEAAAAAAGGEAAGGEAATLRDSAVEAAETSEAAEAEAGGLRLHLGKGGTGYKGVSKFNSGGFEAYYFAGRKVRLGVYDTVLEAAEAYARYVNENGVEEEAPPPPPPTEEEVLAAAAAEGLQLHRKDGNMTGYKGVSPLDGAFEAYFNVRGRKIRLGRFPTAAAAAVAYARHVADPQTAGEHAATVVARCEQRQERREACKIAHRHSRRAVPECPGTPPPEEEAAEEAAASGAAQGRAEAAAGAAAAAAAAASAAAAAAAFRRSSRVPSCMPTGETYVGGGLGGKSGHTRDTAAPPAKPTAKAPPAKAPARPPAMAPAMPPAAAAPAARTAPAAARAAARAAPAAAGTDPARGAALRSVANPKRSGGKWAPCPGLCGGRTAGGVWCDACKEEGDAVLSAAGRGSGVTMPSSGVRPLVAAAAEAAAAEAAAAEAAVAEAAAAEAAAAAEETEAAEAAEAAADNETGARREAGAEAAPKRSIGAAGGAAEERKAAVGGPFFRCDGLGGSCPEVRPRTEGGNWAKHMLSPQEQRMRGTSKRFCGQCRVPADDLN